MPVQAQEGALPGALLNLVATLSADEKAMMLLLISMVAAPIAGYVFARASGVWPPMEEGRLAVGSELPQLPRHMAEPPRRLDRAAQEQEVRQMLGAKAERQRQRGQPPIQVDSEVARLLATAGSDSSAGSTLDVNLRSEIRSLVVARNERRMRKGLAPLDVEAEVERQLSNS